MNSPVLTDGSAFFQLQEEFRAAFDNTVIDLPRSMLIAYPHLMHDVNIAVLTTELTLAAARDSIRILAWLKQNAPHCKILIVANNVQSAVVEISRKDFENTIESKIDLLLPADPKATAQAAKLGQPVVEAMRSSKLSSGIVVLADMISGSLAETAEAELTATKTKKTVFAGFKTMLMKK
jgi:pilus assembly protein CpaE